MFSLRHLQILPPHSARHNLSPSRHHHPTCMTQPKWWAQGCTPQPVQSPHHRSQSVMAHLMKKTHPLAPRFLSIPPFRQLSLPALPPHLPNLEPLAMVLSRYIVTSRCYLAPPTNGTPLHLGGESIVHFCAPSIPYNTDPSNSPPPSGDVLQHASPQRQPPPRRAKKSVGTSATKHTLARPSKTSLTPRYELALLFLHPSYMFPGIYLCQSTSRRTWILQQVSSTKSGIHLTQELRRYVPAISFAIPAHLAVDLDQEKQGRQVWGHYSLGTELGYLASHKNRPLGRCETNPTGHFLTDINMLTSTQICAYLIAR